MSFWITFILPLLMPLALSKRAHYHQTGFLDETIVESFENAPQTMTYSLVECARTCNGRCTRFRYCRRQQGEPGQCDTYTSGSNCIMHDVDPGYRCSCYMLEYSRDSNGSCSCPVGYIGDGSSCCDNVIQDCTEGQQHLHLKDRGNLISFIQPNVNDKPFEVLCHFGYDGLVFIQRRVNNGKYVDFNRSWDEYYNGFGHPEGNHWLGFHKMQQLLQVPHSSFQLDLEFLHWRKCLVYYKNFNFLNGNFAFTGEHGADPQNEWCSYVQISNEAFSTYDRDSTQFNCPSTFAAGWWFTNTSSCTSSSMNSPFVNMTEQTTRIYLDENNSSRYAEEVSIKLKRLP